MPTTARTDDRSGPDGWGDGDDARERWNRRYSERGVHPLTGEPSAWLMESRELLPTTPGLRALDVGCGDGRNAGYLARLGFAVDAVDISDVAIDALRTAAAARRLPVNAVRLDLETDPLPAGPYDVIVQFNYLQRSLFPALGAALAPDGLLLVQTFIRSHVENIDNRFDPRFLLDPGELRGAFDDLEVIRYQEEVLLRSGRARAVASLAARRSCSDRRRRVRGLLRFG